jgi:Amino acid transporters
MATVEHTSSMADPPPLSEKGRTVRTLVEADLLDDRYVTIQRGLKSRHVQLMALGGTIGTGKQLTQATGFP